MFTFNTSGIGEAVHSQSVATFSCGSTSLMNMNWYTLLYNFLVTGMCECVYFYHFNRCVHLFFILCEQPPPICGEETLVLTNTTFLAKGMWPCMVQEGGSTDSLSSVPGGSTIFSYIVLNNKLFPSKQCLIKMFLHQYPRHRYPSLCFSFENFLPTANQP